MPSVFEDYTARVTSRGSTTRDRYENDTENFVNANFSDAPTYRVIDVYAEYESLGKFEVRVNMIERMGNIRNILLRPNFNLNVGNMAKFEDRTWIFYDKYGHIDSGIKLTAMRTNHALQWKDADNICHMVRCYASSSDIGSKSKQNRATIEYNKYDVKLPYGQLYVFIESNKDTRNIDLNHRFLINDIPYEVIGVDNTTQIEDGYGVIQFTVKRTTLHFNDDLELGIAYNSYNSSEQNIVTVSERKALEEVNVEHEKRGGGMIW